MSSRFPRKAGTLSLAALSVLLHFCGSVTAAPSATWPTTEFEVFVGGNTSSDNSLLNDALRSMDDHVDLDFASDLSQPVSRELITEIESYLGEVARTYQQQGFEPPALEPIVTRGDGKKAYRVYLLDMHPEDKKPPPPPATYVFDSACRDQIRPVILINALTSISNGVLTDKAYQDLPHELFHAIQQGYPLIRDNCNLGDWIVEGTAQALGADMAAWSIRKKNYPNRALTWMRDRWGRRAYDLSLWIPDDGDRGNARFYVKDAAYGASSFWRYLGEYAATSGAAGTISVKPDYRYLQDFFSAPLPGKEGEVSELNWLEDQLRSHPRFRKGLGRMYPDFITTFASYVPARFLPRGFLPTDAQDAWLQILFPMEKCPVIELGGIGSMYRGKLTIRANAAGCYRLQLDVNKPVDLHIEASGPAPEQLQALAVGTALGQIVAKPWIKTVAGTTSASWVIHIGDPGQPGAPLPLLVFSNVAAAPATTSLVEADLQIVPAAFEHDMLPEPATRKRQPTSRDPAQTAGKITAASQAARVGADLEAGLEDMNPNLVNSATQYANPEAPPCKDPFVSGVCGPYTSIQLTTVPGMMTSLAQSTGRGGAFGQFLSMMSGVAAVGPMEASKKYEEALQRAGQYDASDVHITIPLIDYGFQGSFNNAAITVSKRGGGYYEAIGPNDIQPGPGKVFPLSGRVTIEEFSTAVLRGSFSASLVDPEQGVDLPEDSPLPVRHQISGRFQVAAPWIEDGRVQREGAEDVVEAVTADVAAAMPGTDVDLDTWLEGASQGGSVSSGGSVTGVGLPACYCSCNTVDSADPACQDYCKPTLAACAGEQATTATLAAFAFKPASLEAAEVVAGGDPFLLSLPEAAALLDA